MATLFDSMATEEPDREAELEEPEEEIVEGFGKYKSAEESEKDNPNDTDLITTFKRLFPSLVWKDINQILQLLMVARIFPDTYIPKKYLTVLSIKRNHPEISVMDIENMVDTAMSIGFNGKSRVEIVLVQGSATQAAEAEAERGNGF